MTRNYGNGSGGRFPYDESKFLPKQREGAIALMEYSFADTKSRKTKQQIADEIGVSRMTLSNWEHHDTNFIAYKNSLSADFFDGYLPFVYRKLIDGISNGSMRGIELFMKRAGDLNDNSSLTINDGSGEKGTFEERSEALKERLGLNEQQKEK